MTDRLVASIEGAGHDLGVEQPEAVAIAIAEFLPTLEGAGTD